MPTTILGITSGPILELCHAVGSEKNQFFGNVVLHALFAQCFEADVNTHFLKSFLTYTCAKLLSFLKTIFEGHQSFLWAHWYPLFWTSGDVCPGFQSLGQSSFACNGFPRLTSCATPADLLVTSTAAQPLMFILESDKLPSVLYFLSVDFWIIRK